MLDSRRLATEYQAPRQDLRSHAQRVDLQPVASRAAKTFIATTNGVASRRHQRLMPTEPASRQAASRHYVHTPPYSAQGSTDSLTDGAVQRRRREPPPGTRAASAALVQRSRWHQHGVGGPGVDTRKRQLMSFALRRRAWSSAPCQRTAPPPRAARFENHVHDSAEDSIQLRRYHER